MGIVMDIKVSIVLPVYNVEKYLRQCLDSIFAQTLEEIEVVAVNDGSTDGSLSVLKEYEEKYSGKMRVFTTENHGVSHARNYGVDRAVGEYVMFVDSDDFIREDMCEILYDKAVTDGNDLVCCGRYNIYSDVDIQDSTQALEVPMEQNFQLKDRKFELTKISPFPWDKLFKREIFEKHKFVEDLRFEDLLFIYTVSSQCKSIGYVKDCLYYYRRSNMSSFLNTFNEATFDLFRSYDHLVSFYRERGILEDYKEEIEYICVRHIFFRFLNMFSPEDYKNSYNEKIAYINRSFSWLNENFPDWMQNHYYKYSLGGRTKVYKKLLSNQGKMKNFVRLGKYFPAAVPNHVISKKSTDMQIKYLKKKVKKIKRKKPAAVRYAKCYKKYSVDEKAILLESKHGEDLAGNIMRMLLTLNAAEYNEYKIYLAVKTAYQERVQSMLDMYGIENVTLVLMKNQEYVKMLASAKYLVTDTSFPAYFVKKEEQVYLNTWHGTPLKYMGRIVPGREYGQGNVQRNFAVADYLLYQQKFSQKVFIEDYMIDQLFDGQVMLSGYPRNSAFFDTTRYENIRKDCGFGKDQQVIVYMPTWRGTLDQKENMRQVKEIVDYIDELDRKLDDNQVFVLKLHPFVKDAIDCSCYKHVIAFPSEYDIYDFLNASDMLVTDYSSIMFDYAVSRKPIILFTYDKEDYLSTRGIYIDFDELDLPMVSTVDELIAEMKKPHEFYEKFYQEFCPYDRAETVKEVCDLWLKGKTPNFEVVDYHADRQRNILVCTHSFKDEQRAAQLIQDINEYQGAEKCYLAVSAKAVKPKTEMLAELNKDVGYIALDSMITNTVFEKSAIWLRRLLKINMKKTLNNMYAREYLRRFGHERFEKIVVYNPSNANVVNTLLQAEGEKYFVLTNFNTNSYQTKGKYAMNINAITADLKNFDKIYVTENVIAHVKNVKKLVNTGKVVQIQSETFTIGKLLNGGVE